MEKRGKMALSKQYFLFKVQGKENSEQRTTKKPPNPHEKNPAASGSFSAEIVVPREAAVKYQGRWRSLQDPSSAACSQGMLPQLWGHLSITSC